MATTHCALPSSGHCNDAQVLAGAGSYDGADPNDSLHEERLHARRRPADFPVRCRTIQSGCPPLTLNVPKREEPQSWEFKMIKESNEES
jgi:hypothetical protein